MHRLPPIDPDARRASTLPASFYGSRGVYDALLEDAFPNSWQWLGSAGELAPGSARPVTLLPGALDEPLALVRDAAGELRCLSNVCTHRGNLLVDAPGACKRLRCRYHGRTFDLAGKFTHMPAFEEARAFPRPEDDLPGLPLRSVCGALFTSLAPELEFEDWLAPLAPVLDALPQDDFTLDPAGVATYDVAAHWALYVDNFLEGFHIPYVHPELTATLADDGYRDELFPHGTLQVGIAREGEPAFEPAQQLGDRPVAAYYAWLWPNTMLNLYPWGLSLNVVEPLGLDRTRVRFVPYVWRPELRGVGAGGPLDAVQREDEEVVESVQRGLRSRLYTRGRFSPTKEPGVHHFHRMLATRLG